MDGRPDLWRPLRSWLSLHPEYKKHFENTVNQMLYDVDGPLPLHHRQFLALMAASRHRCRFLVDLHKAEFVRFGGDTRWLEEGIATQGGRLAHLDTLNRLLAHQPWTIQSHHLQELTRCASGDAWSTWSLSELVHGAVILCQTHALCSFIIGCGISHGSSSPRQFRRQTSSSRSPPEVSSPDACVLDAASEAERQANEVQLLMQRMAEMSSQADESKEEDLAKQFQDINIQSSQLSAQPRPPSNSNGAATTKSAGATPGSRSPNGTAKPAPSKSPTKFERRASLVNKRSLETDIQFGTPPFDCSATANTAKPLPTASPTQIVDNLSAKLSTSTTTNDDRQQADGDDDNDFGDVRPNGVCLQHEGELRACPIARRSSSSRGDGSAMAATASLYTTEPGFAYVDFASRQAPAVTPTLKIHDYSWDDQGYSVVSQLYHQLGDHLEQKFAVIQTLTYHTMGEHEGVDTSKYRQAIWNYIQSLYGIRHDDYNYAEVNALLSIPMKTYVKTMACFPERVTNQLRNSVMQDFLYSEKVHVNVLVAEGRLQAELLYFLRAITRYMM